MAIVCHIKSEIFFLFKYRTKLGSTYSLKLCISYPSHVRRWTAAFTTESCKMNILAWYYYVYPFLGNHQKSSSLMSTEEMTWALKRHRRVSLTIGGTWLPYCWCMTVDHIWSGWLTSLLITCTLHCLSVGKVSNNINML